MLSLSPISSGQQVFNTDRKHFLSTYKSLLRTKGGSQSPCSNMSLTSHQGFCLFRSQFLGKTKSTYNYKLDQARPRTGASWNGFWTLGTGTGIAQPIPKFWERE